MSEHICEGVELNLKIAVLLPGVTRQFAYGRLLHAKCIAMHLALPDFAKIYKSITLLKTPGPICPKHHFSHPNSISHNLYTERTVGNR
jgi:hypothetical protein